MKKWWFWGLCLLIILIYYKTFFLYFSQDDFFSLNWAWAENVGEWVRLWLPRGDVVYYRPLGIPLFFWAGRKLFGLNFWGYRAVAFFVFLWTIYLVFRLAEKLSKRREVGMLTAFFYGVSPLHFVSLAWIVNFSFVLGAFFYFLTIFLYIVSFGKKRFFRLSLLCFLLGILTNEIVLIVPAVILAIDFWLKKKVRIRRFLLFLSIILPYLFLRTLIPPLIEGVYKPGFSIKSLGTLRTYLLWIFGWPEEIKNQLVGFFKVNPFFILSFGKELMAAEVVLVWILVLMVGLPLFLLIFKKRLKMALPLGVFCLFWFLVNLLPFLFLPGHAYPHYATMASFGVYLCLGFLFFEGFGGTKRYVFLRRFVLGVVVFSWIGLVLMMTRFNFLTHWAVRHAERARALLVRGQEIHPRIPSGAQVLVVDNRGEREVMLSGENGIQVFYQDKNIEVKYITSEKMIEVSGKDYASKMDELREEGVYLIPWE